MKRPLFVFVLMTVFASAPAHAKLVDLTPSPNPAAVGTQVRHSIDVGTTGRLEAYVSAAGFNRPGPGTLPPGSWTYRCCPSQTAGTPAWYYRSSGLAGPGSYRFGAVARARGMFLSTVAIGGFSANAWIRIT